jgi:hypothetical protein
VRREIVCRVCGSSALDAPLVALAWLSPGALAVACGDGTLRLLARAAAGGGAAGAAGAAEELREVARVFLGGPRAAPAPAARGCPGGARPALAGDAERCRAAVMGAAGVLQWAVLRPAGARVERRRRARGTTAALALAGALCSGRVAALGAWGAAGERAGRAALRARVGELVVHVLAGDAGAGAARAGAARALEACCRAAVESGSGDVILRTMLDAARAAGAKRQAAFLAALQARAAPCAPCPRRGPG